MKIEDFKGKRITVMGIGLHGGGVGVIKFFYESGAKVLATDLRSAKQLQESLLALKDLKSIKYILGQHREQDFIDTDLIIKNPAVPDDSPFLKIATDHGVPIETDVGIFFELCQGTIIGITGSRGKSTTAALIYQFLKTKYPDAILAGNIRASVLEKLSEIKKTTLVILELSSWQLNGLAKYKKSPQIAVITNIMPDHLNRYTSMQEYITDKKIIFEFQKPENFLILNYGDPTLKTFASRAKSKIYYCLSDDAQIKIAHPDLPQTNQESRIGAYLSGSKIFFGATKEKIMGISHLKLPGKHNLINILEAITVAKLFDIPTNLIRKVLKEFSGLEGRQQFIKEINGVKYINDTTATIPEATIAAINTLTHHHPHHYLILIAGGADKNLNFEELAKIIVKKAKAVILLAGTATKKLEKEIKHQLSLSHAQLLVKKFNRLGKAVDFASSIARKGDIVLLSPGCASFGLFRHEFERGEKFNEAVAKLL